MKLHPSKRAEVLNLAKNLLIEHCHEVVIVAKFISDDPSDCPPVQMTTYASASEALGLLAWAQEKTKHSLWQEFHSSEEEPPEYPVAP